MVYTVGRGAQRIRWKCDRWGNFCQGCRTNTTVGIDLAVDSIRLLVTQVSYKRSNEHQCLPDGRIAISTRDLGDPGSRNQLYS